MGTGELESLAAMHAKEAAELDKRGSAAEAITKYQRAMEILLKLCALYPEHPLRKVYMRNVVSYSRRVEELQGKMPVISAVEEVKVNFEDLIIKEKPSVRWRDVAGLSTAKRAIEESIVFPAKRPDLFPLGWPRGILLFGPPGCGKTLLAAAVAKEINASFYSVDATNIMSKWLGESEKNVAQIFTAARKAASDGKPSILFIDEVDSLVGIRSSEVGGEVRSRNQFLREMDGIEDKKKPIHVYVIGATNKPWVLDEPFIRRFQKRILIPLPDFDARLEMLKTYTGNLTLDPGVDLKELARILEGYSGSDILDIGQAAQMKVVRELFESTKSEDANTKPRALTMQDFKDAIRTRKTSVSENVVLNYNRWAEIYGAA